MRAASPLMLIVALALTLCFSSPAAAATPPTCPPAGCSTGNYVQHSITITNNLGVVETHNYDTYRPGGLDDSPSNLAPLMMVLHDGTGSIQGAEKGSQMAAVAVAQGFVAVFPQAGLHGWSKPITEVNPPDAKSDVPFLMQLLDQLLAQENIDPSRVYVTGGSAGAQMTIELMCDPASSSRFAGFAPVSGNMQTPLAGGVPNCPAANRNFAFLELLGTADSYIPFNGSTLKTKTLLSEPAMMDFVRSRMGCAPALPTVSFGTTAATKRATWPSCSNPSAPVEDIVSPGGHSWEGLSGTDGLQPAQEIWNVLSQSQGSAPAPTDPSTSMDASP